MKRTSTRDKVRSLFGGSGLTVSTQIWIKCCSNFYCAFHCVQTKKNLPKSKDLLTGGAPLKEPLKRAPTGPQDLAIGRGPRRKPSIDHYRGLGSEGLFVRAPADGEVWRLGGKGEWKEEWRLYYWKEEGGVKTLLLGGSTKNKCRWEGGERKEEWRLYYWEEAALGGGWVEGGVKTLLLGGSTKK